MEQRKGVWTAVVWKLASQARDNYGLRVSGPGENVRWGTNEKKVLTVREEYLGETEADFQRMISRLQERLKGQLTIMHIAPGQVEGLDDMGGFLHE